MIRTLSWVNNAHGRKNILDVIRRCQYTLALRATRALATKNDEILDVYEILSHEDFQFFFRTTEETNEVWDEDNEAGLQLAISTLPRRW